jgi:hypothetical protein
VVSTLTLPLLLSVSSNPQDSKIMRTRYELVITVHLPWSLASIRAKVPIIIAGAPMDAAGCQLPAEEGGSNEQSGSLTLSHTGSPPGEMLTHLHCIHSEEPRVLPPKPTQSRPPTPPSPPSLTSTHTVPSDQALCPRPVPEVLVLHKCAGCPMKSEFQSNNKFL